MQVRNLHSDWKNGCAFLALLNGALGGTMDMDTVRADREAHADNISQASSPIAKPQGSRLGH